MKKILCAVLALVAVISMSSCNLITKLINENYAENLVRGNLDSLYLGKISDEYVKQVASTKEAIEKDYKESLEYEAESFAYYWGITGEDESIKMLDDELENEIIALCAEIYSHAKYEVKGSTRQGDGSFAVQVTVEPMDIMIRASELYDRGGYAPLDAFLEKSSNIDWESISENQYFELMDEYARIIVNMVKSLMPELGYKEKKSMVIQVIDHGDYIQMSEDDLAIFDSYILIYE